MHNRSILVIQLVLFLICLPFSSYSQEILESIEVKNEKNLKEFDFGSYFQFESQDFKSSGTLLSDQIKSTPFVMSASNGGIGSRNSYFLRGAESRHVLFSLDGMKLNDPSSVDRQFDDSFLNLDLFKEINIFRGPKSTLFGADSIGGLIDLRMPKGENAPDLKLSLITGSFGTAQSSLKKDWRSQNGRGSLSGSFFRTDGISRLNSKRFSATERDGSQSVNLSSSSLHRINDQIFSDFIFSYSRNQSELDGYQTDNSTDQSQLGHLLIQQNSKIKMNEKNNISFRTGVSQYNRKITNQGLDDFIYKGILNQNEVIYDWEAENKIGIIGLLNENENLSESNLSKKNSNFSLFSQNKFSSQLFDFQYGLRLDHHQQFGEFLTGTSGVQKSFGDQKVGFQYSRGFKAPTLYQLYGVPVNGFPVGNRNLSPEFVNSYELNFQHKVFDIVLFKNDFNNLITYSNLGYLNQDGFEASGVEVLGKIIKNSYRLTPFISYTDYNSNKDQILRRPNLTQGLDFQYFYGELFEFNSSLRTFSSRKDLDIEGNTVKLNSYELFNMGIRYFYHNSKYGINILNVFDRDYEEIYGYSVMPRSFFLNYELTF